ncbi:hypothetical protein [Erinnyis ello granulovirus]|uniref:Uncharacterized protein n=1 Tax=Erinnyis ello granulovirus TaxID=307444 RepID=A0A097DAK6_9BBAC|nr:hypothetical protein [Erinnyis ello granulovirus]AIS92030.1 hypothetical protein [Erinnyis ello granulovirus]ARX71369.1 hypothetical protein EREL_030 [Erinnyis ello granulovirus]ARX71499.1 hypothetical protein EREL_030 [Erinnyis ello granulovirus]ARX71629.1 hypothetical protein EREL_030 [Erinnyis ello granulovirus]ARX71759.1 hypothetical protein EREL_030 [Erinnyis ello granulovirus]
MYYFECVYDDLCEFEWCVLLSRDTLQLWLDVTCLKSKGFVIPDDLPVNKYEENVTSYTLNDSLEVIEQEISLADKNLHFCTSTQLLNLNSTDDYYVTVLYQFLYHHLPKHLSVFLNNLRLLHLYDIEDYWNAYKSFDTIRKYWLFRWRIICVMYEQNNTNNENDVNDSKSLATLQANKLGFISCDKNLVTTLNENVKQQFVYMNECNDVNKLHIMLHFNKLLVGTVGLLEVMINWK